MSVFADYLREKKPVIVENKMDNSEAKSEADDAVEKLAKVMMNVSVPGSDSDSPADKKFWKAMTDVCDLCEKAAAKLKPWT